MHPQPKLNSAKIFGYTITGLFWSHEILDPKISKTRPERPRKCASCVRTLLSVVEVRYVAHGYIISMRTFNVGNGEVSCRSFAVYVYMACSYDSINKPRPYAETARDVTAKGATMPKKKVVPLLREVRHDYTVCCFHGPLSDERAENSPTRA